jgi:L-2-hydroxycarboxylate dehydrogenase (NAD+)
MNALAQVAADVRGADAHGVFRLPQYVRRIRSGGINRRPASAESRTTRPSRSLTVTTAWGTW